MSKLPHISVIGLLMVIHLLGSPLLLGQDRSPYDVDYSPETPIPHLLNNEQLPLSDALKIVEAHYNIHIFFESALLEGFYIEKPRTFYSTPFIQLQQMLDKTHLLVTQISEQTFVITAKRREGRVKGVVRGKNTPPLMGATICIPQLNLGTSTNLYGQYELALPPGNYEAIVRYVGYKQIQRQLQVSPDSLVHCNFDLKEYTSLEEIVIVGSPFNSTAALKKTAPADVINAQAILSSSQSETGQLLQYTIPSFHSTPQTISDGTDHIAPATLRGLGPDQVLVLVNGKRRHSSALVNINGTIGRGTVATDLNAIPLAAIEKVEVLRDGAAVQYGSDAIAGLINIVLKKDINFIDINAFSGLSQQGDGEVFQISSAYGFALGNRNGYAHITMDFRKKAAINRSGNYTGPIFGDRRDLNSDSLQLFFDQTGFSDQRVMSIGEAATTDAHLFFNANLPIGKNINLYSFGGLNYRLGKSFGFYRFPYQHTRQSGLFPFGFSPEIHANIFDRSFTLGVNRKNVPWQIDFSNTTGSNRFDFGVFNSNNASLGLASPTSAKAGGFEYTQNVTNLDIAKKVDGPFPLHLGFGSEFRLENYQLTAGEEISWQQYQDTTDLGQVKEAGFQVFPGFRPENSTHQYRHNLGLYANLELELTPSLFLNLAGRHEFYSDFGNHLIWKIGSRYTFHEWLTVRGSFNTGFRAPSMPQIHFSSRAFQFISVGHENEGVQIAHLTNASPITRQFGIMPLQAEKSKNISLGLAARLPQNTSITLDAYRIDIVDRIILTGRFSADDDPRFAEILEPTGIRKAQFFTNAIDTKTQGLDFTIKHKIHFKKSELLLSLVGNIMMTRLKTDQEGKALIRTSDLLNGFENILFNREEISRIEVAQPNNKIIFNSTFKTPQFSIHLNFIRFGKIWYIHPNDQDPNNWVVNQLTGQKESRDQEFSAKWLTNLKLHYHFSNHMTVSIGVNNLFNVYPDRHQHSANISNGLFQYSRRTQQFGVNGAFWYGKVNLRF